MSEEPFVITLRDVYLEVREVRGQVNGLTSQAEKVTDHEVRIRGLERWRYALPGALLLAGASIVVAVLEGSGHG